MQVNVHVCNVKNPSYPCISFVKDIGGVYTAFSDSSSCKSLQVFVPNINRHNVSIFKNTLFRKPYVFKLHIYCLRKWCKLHIGVVEVLFVRHFFKASSVQMNKNWQLHDISKKENAMSWQSFNAHPTKLKETTKTC